MNSKTFRPFASGLSSVVARSARAALLTAAGLVASIASAQQTIYILDGTNLRTAPLVNPAAITAPLPITGVNGNETLVGIDVRPQNQQLYGLGVNAVANTATLYCISPKTGFAGVVGTAGFSFTTNGTTAVDFPDPAVVGWEIDFNPAADRLRVVAGTLNFRVNPSTGVGVDGDNGGAAGSVTGVNPDGAINGGTTTVHGTAYTNNRPNNGGIATQYTLDAVTNSLFIQNPPNAGTQTSGVTVTLGGSTLDFTSFIGFDIPPNVNAPASNAPVTAGFGFALLRVGGVAGLYSINLVNGQATLIGNVPNGRSIAIRQELGPAIALDAAGTSLLRFDVSTPGTVTTQALNLANVVAGEALVGVDFRPQTGQFYALGINHNSETGTLYLLDPQNGAVTIAVTGTASAITFAAVDFPNPAAVGYGMDFNPTVDRLRVVTSSGLNFRINPNTGLPAAATTDGAINGSGVAGVSAAAYTNSYPQSLTGGVTTLYTLDAATNSLYIQNPPNNGTQTSPLPVTVGGIPLDFTDQNALDIPSDVAVTASNTPAVGDGWFVATVGGTTRLYRLDLATGAATFIGNIGTGATPLIGLTVFATPVVESANDAATVTTGSTTVFPLANDGVDSSFEITAVSNVAITINPDGRSLSVPSSFTGSFTYLTSDGTSTGVNSITVTAGTPVDSPSTYNGLLTASDTAIVGSATATISSKGLATVKIVGGAVKASTKISVPTPGSTGANFTPLGYVTLKRELNGTLKLSLVALGGEIGGTLLPVKKTATAAKHHIALASIDSAFGGGGYAIANVSSKGAVKISGLLPDGVPFSAAGNVRDNNTIAIYTMVKGPKPPTLLGGELTVANLTKTDVTGQIAWAKQPQLAGVKGLHLGGVDTAMNANGSLFDGTAPLPTGNGTLKLSGGGLVADESTAVVISADGVPEVPTGALVAWTGVNKKVGKFSAKVTVPTITKPVKGSGLYLPKSNRAWGFFPGKTVGGRIELTVP